MENLNSHINKILGTEEDKDKISEKLQGYGTEEIDSEIEKTPRDIEIIDFSQKYLNEYLIEYGIKNLYNVNYNSIHVVPCGGVEEFKKGKFKKGVASSILGSCVVDRSENDVTFSVILFHEMFHLKNFTSIEKKKDDGLCDGYDIRRSGFSILSKNGELLKQVDETINNYFCKKFFEEKIKYSEIFKADDINNFKLDTNIEEFIEKFESICRSLYENNKNNFASVEDVKKLFIDATLNGNILPVARIIDKTYGEGSFVRGGRKYIS